MNMQRTPHASTICPYNFTNALAESAVINGAMVSLSQLTLRVMDTDIIQRILFWLILKKERLKKN